ncbi:Pentatricopeptide repeat-containing protein, mitochondrial [Sesamum alatum]|uniref:Pentatricopeptide repeat-containing protein, mitochondrial n=1 Tax=Sesamum alatum TaxID=300844 RepID=A0AAE1XVP6_9LAMI|nr:Pentatricopeptide repeat-containing protein, mitochondrial [Sesamum alatum]
MWRRRVADCKRVIAAERACPWRQQIYANCPTSNFFCNSTASFSSSSYSRKSSSLHNYYIRKRRKWPIRPYKTEWHQAFAFQLAKQSFKRSIRKSKTHLLSDLISSFAAYEVESTPQSYHFLFKVLIHNRPSNWDDQVSQILEHIEKVESFETPECMFIDLIKFYGDNNMLNDAVELFFRIPKFRCEPSVEVLNTLLSVLCRSRRGLEIVPQILMNTQGMNIRIEESSFEILIRALCRIGRVSNAFELLNHMVEEGFGVNQKVCSLMLATMCRQLNYNTGEVMGFLEELKGLGFEPRRDDLCNVIRFLVNKEKVEDALGLLKQMKMNGLRPDILCYNLVLDGLIFQRDFLRADKVFDELLVLGLIPNIHTYNVYINGLCMQKKVGDGINMLHSMEELGCAPELSTYSTILRALCEAGELIRAREMVNRMQQKCMQLNSETYEIIIDGFVSNGDIDAARSLLNEMLDKNLVPPPPTLDKIICWFCKNGLSIKAAELLGEVVIKDIAPGASAWRALIQECDLTFNVERIVDLTKNQLQVDNSSVQRS